MFDTLRRSARQRFGPASAGAVRSPKSATCARPCARVRVALLEADVALAGRPQISSNSRHREGRRPRRCCQAGSRSGQMVVKIVNDALIETLGSETAELDLNCHSASA